ncbi:MAG: hypothetical protein L6R39_007019 [Caloplaca ligustica]|nr:MAG: hypothetical protein L6R39_007019 [Caloplaca ligustica]
MRLDPAELAAYDKRKIEWSQLKEAMARLRKDACMKRELKRAMKTKISPPSFQVIDDDDFLTEEGSHRALSNSTLGTGNGLDYDVFAGQITIRDHLGAMRQALSEHSKDGPRRKEPGRHSFHVDAAVSRKHDLTGIGVVFKTHRQNWASLWTVRGYQIGKKLDQNDAELWAIWQALEIVLKRVNGDIKRRYGKSEALFKPAVWHKGSETKQENSKSSG